MLKKQGFTLIELIIVVIIIGLLSASAAAKFVSLSRDARIANVEAIRGALNSTALLVELKAKVENVYDGDIDIDGYSVAISDGYIAGIWDSAWRHTLDIGKDIAETGVSKTCTENLICAVGGQTDHQSLPDSITITYQNGLLMLWLEGDTLNEECFAYYYNPGFGNTIGAAAGKAITGIVSDGC